MVEKCEFKGFFPYPSLRPYQDKAIEFSCNVFREGLIGLLSSPCGTGKSISVLTGYLAAGGPDIGRLLVLTRTKNQSDVYCRELQALRVKCGVRLVASIFVNRQDMCPLAKRRGFKASYRDFLMLCRALRKGVGAEVCEYYVNTMAKWYPTRTAKRVVEDLARMGVSTPDVVYEIASGEGLCPYEVTKLLSARAHVVIGSYNYALMDPVRENVLGKMGLDVEDVNCVFDEAHSLPLYAADLLSDELSLLAVERAMKEAEDYDVDDMGLIESLRDFMTNLEEELLKAKAFNEEKLVDHGKLIMHLIESLRLGGPSKLEVLIEYLEEEGERIRLQRVQSGKPAASYVGRVSSFLQVWLETQGRRFAKYALLESYGATRRFKLGVRCLDPSIASRVLNEFRSCILMSGTLWEPDYYVDVLGLDERRVKFLELPSPFPKENMMVIVDMAVTTKFERRSEAEWSKISDRLASIIEAVDGRVAVFFPSYEVMMTVMSKIKDRLSVPIMVEDRSTKMKEVKEFVVSNERCLIAGVARGKVSEGVEVVSEGRSLLNVVVLVGLPYPKNTELHQALTEYFKEKFGDLAFKYANTMPCAIAIAQSAGRLIRGPEDRGVVIMMDSRAARSFKRYLPRDWVERMRVHLKIERIVEDVKNFISASSTKS